MAGDLERGAALKGQSAGAGLQLIKFMAINQPKRSWIWNLSESIDNERCAPVIRPTGQMVDARTAFADVPLDRTCLVVIHGFGREPLAASPFPRRDELAAPHVSAKRRAELVIDRLWKILDPAALRLVGSLEFSQLQTGPCTLIL